jgi:hypothetical protein
MVIDQRNAGAATANTINGYTIDRWVVNQSVTGKLIAQQNAGSVTPPAGFTNYLGVTSQSSYSVLTSDFYAIGQVIEGFNVADLAWGTANAATITLSFWVRSSLTGTFGGAIQNSAQSRSYPFTYTISAANTWEKETITIAGDTSGTWLTNNSAGLRLFIGLGAGATYSGTAGSWSANNFWSATGATSVVGTNGATFYFTGVQLERNTTATPFEWIPYGTELALCQRYFYKTFSQTTAVTNGTTYAGGISVPSATAYGTSAIRFICPFPQPMRATPTTAYYSISGLGTVGSGLWQYYLGSWTAATGTINGEVTDLYVAVDIQKTSAFTTGYSYLVGGLLTASAEL